MKKFFKFDFFKKIFSNAVSFSLYSHSSYIDCIIALSFAMRKIGGGSSPCNEKIATMAAKIVEVPAILQWEIADILKETRDFDVFRIEKHRIEGKYLDSEEVLSQAKIICNNNGLKCPLVIANKMHLPRVSWQAEKIFGKGNFFCLSVDAGYDPKSTQWWTRGPTRWWLREVLVRIFLLLQGKI